MYIITVLVVVSLAVDACSVQIARFRNDLVIII